MKRIIAIFITIVLFLSAVCVESYAAGNSAEVMYEEGMEFFEKEDYDRAFARFQIAGEVRGYAPAQNMLGVCYRDGLGVEQNDEEAEKYFRLSADQGYAPAQENLTSLYYTTGGNGLINGIPANGSGYVYMGGIKWRVLGKGSSSWLLISADVLGGTMNWENAKNYGNSQMSAWFSRVEQDAVLLTSKTEAYDSGFYQSASGYIYSATDLNGESLFLLSAEEAETYFSGDDDRQPGQWWLRSPNYDYGYLAGFANGFGILHDNYVGNYSGARPAFQLNLSSVLFTSATSGGKSSAAVGGGDFGTLTGDDELKLTLIDGSSFSAVVNGSDSASIPSDGRIEITYSEVSDGRQVSALLYVGDTVYYATHTPDGTGKWTVTLPSGLSSADTYTLKVFSEQLNGNYKTDYASTPAVITLNGRNMGVDTDPDDFEEEQQRTSDEEKETGNDTQIDLSLISMGDYVTFAAYEQDNNLANGPEPIEWQVLDVQDGEALLLSRYALASKPFEEDNGSVTWETSTLRAWLNSEFYNNAFSEKEKASIITGEVSADKNPKYDTSSGSNTEDRVFLLSVQEAEKYFSDNAQRLCQITDAEKEKTWGDNSCWWWLRTAGNSAANAAVVNNQGAILNSGDSIKKNGSIRPAIRVKIKTSLEPIYGSSLNAHSVKKAADMAAIKGKIAVLQFGSYEQDNNLNNGKEPIEWQVLEVKDDKALLLSCYGLDSLPFNSNSDLVTWETCSLRNWLNDTFFREAFPLAAERNAILTTAVTADNNPNYNIDPGKDTRDKVFLLSISEAVKCFSSNLNSDRNRECSGTKYCDAQGGFKEKYNGIERCVWWLRSPGKRANMVAFIGLDGYVSTVGRNYYIEGGVVRPAIWINLQP